MTATLLPRSITPRDTTSEEGYIIYDGTKMSPSDESIWDVKGRGNEATGNLSLAFSVHPFDDVHALDVVAIGVEDLDDFTVAHYGDAVSDVDDDVDLVRNQDD